MISAVRRANIAICSMRYVNFKDMILVNSNQLINGINVKNFLGNLTTVVRAQNDTSKTANSTYTIFDRTLV